MEEGPKGPGSGQVQGSLPEPPSLRPGILGGPWEGSRPHPGASSFPDLVGGTPRQTGGSTSLSPTGGEKPEQPAYGDLTSTVTQAQSHRRGLPSPGICPPWPWLSSP